MADVWFDAGQQLGRSEKSGTSTHRPTWRGSGSRSAANRARCCKEHSGPPRSSACSGTILPNSRSGLGWLIDPLAMYREA